MSKVNGSTRLLFSVSGKCVCIEGGVSSLWRQSGREGKSREWLVGVCVCVGGGVHVCVRI